MIDFSVAIPIREILFVKIFDLRIFRSCFKE